MGKKIHSNKFNKYWLPVIIYAIIIFIHSSIPESELVEKFEISDKLLHLLGYSVLGYLFLRALFNYGYDTAKKQLILLAIFYSTLYGISDEIHQYFVPLRSPEVMDAVFNFFGSTLGAVAYNYRYGRNKTL